MQSQPRDGDPRRGPGSFPTAPPAAAAQLLAAAICSHQSGDLESALAGYKAVLARDPNHALVHHNLGAVYGAQGALDKASAAYRRAIAANPHSAESHFGLAATCQRQGRVEQAIAHYRRTVELAPDHAAAHYNAAILLHAKGLPEEAIPHYKHTIQLQPDCPEAYNDLGSVLQSLCLPGQAAAAFSEAARLRPAFAEAHNNLAASLVEQDRLPQAEAACLQALHERPDLVQARYNLGRVQLRSGRAAEAAGTLERVVTVAPTLLSAHQALADALRARGDTAGALRVAWNEIRIGLGKDRRRPPGDEATTVAAALDRIDEVLPADLRHAEAAVWIFDRQQLVGHLSLEPFHFRNVFGEPGRRLIAVVPPATRQPRANRAIVDIALRDFTVVETSDAAVLGLASRNLGIIERGCRTYALCSYDMLARAYFQHRQQAKRTAFYALSPVEQARGPDLRRRLGIDEGAKIVVIHMRDAGFHRHRAVAHAFRNVTLDNYLPAIRHLAAEGYHVVRIGDRSMPRLPDLGPRVSDAPFLADYDPLVDPYFIANCEFMISCNSGPCSLARAFGRICLVVNAPVNPTFIPEKFELLAFKKYVDRSEGNLRPLSYAEILERRLHDIYSTVGFADRQIELREMTGEEILDVTQEMIERLGGRGPASTSQEFHKLNAAEHARRAADAGANVRLQDWFGYVLPSANISAAYCRHNPGFLAPS